jgi:PKD repeat protein
VKIEVRSYPKAVISSDNTTVDEGEDILFDGSKSSDKDGNIYRYIFEFGDGEDSGWIAQSTVEHSFQNAGTYTVSLKVRDDHEDISTNKATLRITVEVPNKRPVAQIIDISPQPVSKGREVAFLGASQDEDGRVVTFLWTSNLHGEIGSEETFFTSSLSDGTHVIKFMVQDDRGDWSQEASRVIEVKESNEIPQVTITYPHEGKRFTDSLTITGSSEDPDGSLKKIEIQIDFGSWEEIAVDTMWTHTINLSTLSSGEHTIAIRAYDGEDYSEEEYLTFSVGEEEEEQDMMLIFTLVILVIIVVIIIAIIIGRVYKKNPTEVPLAQGPQVTVTRTFEPAQKDTDTTETRINW